MMHSKFKRVFHWSPSYLTLKSLANDNAKRVNGRKNLYQ